MASTDFASYTVHIGTWTDWSRGRILGATLTLSREDGNLIIALLAFFVAFVGSRLWRILCFFLHLAYSRNLPRDGLHHQRQVLLRNLSSPGSVIVALTRLIACWRRHTNQVWARIIPSLLAAAFCCVGFALASGFSSRVATVVNNEVLLSGNKCGYVDIGLADDNLTTVLQDYSPFRTRDMISADSYARRCYSTATSGGLSCDTFVKQHLQPAIVKAAAACPFEPRVCKSNDSNLLLDTGLLDSHEDFGRNSPAEQRFQYRRVVQCAPLQLDGYRSYVNVSGKSYVRYQYGNSVPGPEGGGRTNFTEQFPMDVYLDNKDMAENHGDTGYDYSIRFDLVEPYNGSVNDMLASFIPIPELERFDADLYLFFLTAEGIIYSKPVLDPWYYASRRDGQLHDQMTLSGNIDVYRQDEPGSPLACIEQHQLCFAAATGGDKCTPLMSSGDLANLDYIPKYIKDQEQQRQMEWMYKSTIHRMVRILHPITFLGLSSLVSRVGLNGGHQAPLPDNQWQIDVQHWHSLNMAHLQERFIDTVVGPPGKILETVFRHAESPGEKELCRNQKIRAANYISFSLPGVLCILLAGGIIILVSVVLQPLSFAYRRRLGYPPYADLEWRSNGTLQLLRLAHEGAGLGTWTGATRDVPYTAPGEVLGVLDILDPVHPRLRAYESEVDDEDDNGEDREGGLEK